MLLRRQNSPRRGTTLPEMALTITALLMLALGAIDLGMAVFRQNVLSHAARQGVRQAAVHGRLARSGWKGGPWGPNADTNYTYGPVAATDADRPGRAKCYGDTGSIRPTT